MQRCMDRESFGAGTARRRHATATGALIALLLPAVAVAGAGVWTPIGPDTGVIGALAAAPGEPRTLYALSSFSGLFKTTDGGDSWASVDQGIALRSAFLMTVAVGLDGTVLAGGMGGIWRSVDDGASWQPSPPVPSLLPGLQFAFDPRDARIAHVAAGFDGIYKSADGGVSWTVELSMPYTPLSSYYRTVAVAPWRREVLFAGSDWGLDRSSDGGRSWQHVLPSCNVTAVAFDPARAARVFAGCGGSGIGFPSPGGVMTSANGGVTWRPTALPQVPVSSLAFLAGVGSSAAIYAATGSGVFRSADDGANWTRLHGLGAVNALAVSPLRHPVLFAGLPGSGVFRSADGGASWSGANRGLTAPVQALAADPAAGGRLYIVTNGAGAFSTRDAGGSWIAIDRGLTDPFIASLAVAPLAPSTLYARDSLTNVFISTDAGKTWLKRSPPASLQLGSILCGPFVDPRDPLHILVGGYGGSVGASSDGGSTWQAHQVTAHTPLVAVVFAPSAPAIVYASGFPDEGAFKSTDGGVTWIPIGPPGFGTTVLAVDPNDPSTVYASYDRGVYKTVDGGGTWTLGSPIPVGVTAVALDPRLPGTVIAGTGWPAPTGVWISRDGGATWTPFGSGLPSQLGVSALAFDGASPATLYAATGFGVYELQLATPAP